MNLDKPNNQYFHKYFSLISNDINYLKEPKILEFGVGKGNTTSLFLEICKKNNGKLYSVDVEDFSKLFNDKYWQFIQCRDDEFEKVENNIDKEFDIICLDTLHNTKHIKKIFNHYYPKLKKDGIFLIDGVSCLPYLKGNERNNFFGEVISIEIFIMILEIYNCNKENMELEFSFIGSGVAKLKKINNKSLNINNKLNLRYLSFKNILRKIYHSFRR